MTGNQHLLSKLQAMLGWKKSKKVYADKLGITEKEVDELLEELRKKDDVRDEAEAGNYISELEEMIVKVNNEKGTVESIIESSFEPKSDEELATLHKINLDKYKISNYWTKQKSNGKFTSSVFATLKQPKDYTPEDFAKFLENYTPKDIEVIVVTDDDSSEKELVDIEISIADFHLAKKTLEKESIGLKKKQFMSVLRDLTKKVLASHKIGKVVFPISNDFFHTDNYQNTTTNGTPQDVLVGYDKEYEAGFDLLVEAITYLSVIAEDVEIVLVQGNHDRTKSFYLAHALEVFFSNTSNVTFQRNHSVVKHVTLGDTFIGYHHGNCKLEDLPLLFATNTNSSLDFGICKYREVHTGDKHHYMAKEIKGVRIQQMPSLSGTDRWHLDNNFVNSIRAGLVLIYHPQHGKIGEYESRI